MKEPQQNNKGYNKRKLVYVILGTTLGVYLGIEYILPLVVPFIFAYFIAKSIQPIIVFMQKRLRIPRMVGGAITLLSLLFIMGIGIYFLFGILLNQVRMVLQNIPIYQQIIMTRVDALCCNCDIMFGLGDGESRSFLDSNMGGMADKVKTDIMPAMTEHTLLMLVSILGLVGILFVVMISALMIIKDMPELKRKFEEGAFYQQIHPVTHTLCNMGFAYLRAQFIIISIIAVIFTFGLFLMGNPYALLIGVGIACFDAFPVLGSGSILIPWSITQLIQGNIFATAVLMSLYLCGQLVRQFLEPKLIGDKIGIKPIFAIMAMYIGLRIFGIVGVFLGPFALVTIITIVKQTQENIEI